ncbi:hypothetical protein EMIT0111MI5_40438 [Burkholderia sp. IT-111MI5]
MSSRCRISARRRTRRATRWRAAPRKTWSARWPARCARISSIRMRSRGPEPRRVTGRQPAGGVPVPLEAMVLVPEGWLRYDRPLVASTARQCCRRRPATGIRARSGAADCFCT